LGAIADTLHIGRSELSIVEAKYRDCLVINQTNSNLIIQKYLIIIPNEDENSYYEFLLDNCIAMFSSKFRSRASSDTEFAQCMRARMSEYILKVMNYTEQYKKLLDN
jgi:hypothetical protein